MQHYKPLQPMSRLSGGDPVVAGLLKKLNRHIWCTQKKKTGERGVMGESVSASFDPKALGPGVIFTHQKMSVTIISRMVVIFGKKRCL